MRSRFFSIIAVCAISIMVFVSGCASTADLALKFSADQTDTYTVTTEMIKDFRFEQPTMNKLREEQTRTTVKVTFDQTIESVDDAGSAVAVITVKDFMVDMINKNEPKFKFNSADSADAKNPMSKLIGKSYKIKINPDGSVGVVDLSGIKKTVVGGYEGKMVGSLFDDKAVIERHEVLALPKDTTAMTVNDTWTALEPSPPGLLAPKSYNKTYTLESVSGNVATVGMKATESAVAVAGQSAMSGGSMGMFAKMFDNEDDFSGTMQLDTTTGKVLDYKETLVSKYIAQEMPKNGDPEKGPDTLLMQFTHLIDVKKVD